MALCDRARDTPPRREFGEHSLAGNRGMCQLPFQPELVGLQTLSVQPALLKSVSAAKKIHLAGAESRDRAWPGLVAAFFLGRPTSNGV